MEEEGGSASSFNSFCPVRSDPAWADKRLRSLHVQCFFTCQSNCYKTTPCSGMDIEPRNYILFKIHEREPDCLLWSESSDISSLKKVFISVC
ncbi:rCG41668, isoform CRA_b [Rattus norvegicus]|uniref:RCG41668, isoform CRA_b n=1 Tax=Rattus norvegicus TaxID=10116 RepID=A6IHU5_RAT|nr:rCG41668, isoform CRA_b [Rattus norvegicus]EDM01242.1 rCG41668, isoform CRA_b [Rattus norvegicus]EDM01244.1 rCG41668, isoform CRA_b [Rattus norvegicus]EDM01245.1 rCG41668, isoform CRA_b [Rattus norvegicus]EDM01246.1 rCG41668, isoform CRA_b [Rattus norvegicus]